MNLFSCEFTNSDIGNNYIIFQIKSKWYVSMTHFNVVCERFKIYRLFLEKGKSSGCGIILFEIYNYLLPRYVFDFRLTSGWLASDSVIYHCIFKRSCDFPNMIDWVLETDFSKYGYYPIMIWLLFCQLGFNNSKATEGTSPREINSSNQDRRCNIFPRKKFCFGKLHSCISVSIQWCCPIASKGIHIIKTRYSPDHNLYNRNY